MRYCYFVISCKKNRDVLNEFLICLSEFKDSETEIYVSSDGDMGNLQYEKTYIYIDNKSNFGNRIANAVKQIPYEYIIVMCDDFLVEKKIDSAEINSLISLFDKDDLISSISLASTSGEYIPSEPLLLHYYQKKQFANYKATLQCSIWNKNAFISLMRGVVTPWEFELFSNQLTFLTKNKFYSLIDDSYQPIKYNRGTLIIRGKAVIPEIQRIEKVLGRKLHLESYEKTTSYTQISNMSVTARISRRLRLSIGKVKYEILSLFEKCNLNI